jgi:hypothetical protein
MVFGAAGFTTLTLQSDRNNQNEQKTEPGKIRLEVVQLPADRGIIPVAIQGESLSPNPESGLTEAVFLVKNNTSKNINAISVAVTGRVERDGKETSSTGYLTINSLVHPDIREIHNQHALGPGEEWSFKTEPFEIDDPQSRIVLRGITLQIDYVDFEDQTEIGPNKYGSNIVTKARSGAARYKAWLTRKYVESGRSVAAVLPLLARGQALPPELALGDHERTGARLYQSHLLKAFQHHGGAEVEKYLSRSNSTNN